MRKAPFIQFYVADYMTDSKVNVLSLEAQGLYIRILCSLWLEAEPYLPSDEYILSRILGVPENDFKRIWKEFWIPGFELFILTDDKKHFTQKRLLSEWNKMCETSEKRRIAQKKSVISRIKNKEEQEKPGDMPGNSTKIANTANQSKCVSQNNSKAIAKQLQTNCNATHSYSYSYSDSDSYSDSYSDSDDLDKNSSLDNISTTERNAIAETSIEVISEPISPPSKKNKNNENIPPCPLIKIKDLYHEVLFMLPQVRVFTEKRKRQIRQRWREYPERQNLNWWKCYFQHISSSQFLTGKVQSKGRVPFVADLEWITNPNNMAKILEGKYHNKARSVFAQASEKGLDKCISEILDDFK